MCSGLFFLTQCVLIHKVSETSAVLSIKLWGRWVSVVVLVLDIMIVPYFDRQGWKKNLA